MTEDLKPQLTIFLLATITAAAKTGLTQQLLLQQARVNLQIDITEPEFAHELRSQADKGWIVSFTPAVGSPRWRVTNFGASVAQEQGLA